MLRIKLISIVILIASFSACSNMEEDWRDANQAHTVAALASFLSDHPTSSYAKQAREQISILWAAAVPEKAQCEIESDLSVNVTWPEVAGARDYILYSSAQPDSPIDKATAIPVIETSFIHKVERNDYGPGQKIYYRVAAVREEGKTKLSAPAAAELLDDKSGTVCQICGKPSIGWCHIRNIYVCSYHNTFTDHSGTHWRCP